MLGLLERKIATLAEDLVILAPPGSDPPGHFRRAPVSDSRREALLHEMQRLRGRIYLEDGALKADQLTDDGRHETREDRRSWHLLIRDKLGHVSACLWYLEHERRITIDDLRVPSCPTAQSDDWGDFIHQSVNNDIARAERERIPYAEVGGWAASRQGRCSADGLLLILSTFGLSRMFGGALGITTATVRHCSATILKRLGLAPVPAGDAVVPAYFDPRYGCDMELLRFDTRRANPKYEGLVRLVMESLTNVAIVVPESATARHRRRPMVALADGAAA